MRIIRHLKNIDDISPCALTIGNFDGVHLGHQKIIEATKERAKRHNLKSAALTFFPHPIKFFRPDLAQNFLISSLARKLKTLKQHSFDYVFVLPFDQNFSNISPEDFIAKVLIKQLKMRELIIGYDFTFGKNRQGNFDFLKQKSSSLDFGVQSIEAFMKSEILCSSSKVRELLKLGKVDQAGEILGRNFEIEGVVLNGKKLARTIGFPTLNLAAKPHLIQPKFGVYKVEVLVPSLQKNFSGVMNFGVKPTIGNFLAPIYEIHLFDFDEKIYGPLYGKKIIAQLVDFIREEKKFSSIDELKKQIEIDVSRAKSRT